LSGIAFTATVTAPGMTPTGEVWFYPPGERFSIDLVNGTATWYTTNQPGGTFVVNAAYLPARGSPFAFSVATPVTQTIIPGVTIENNQPTANSASVNPTLSFVVSLGSGTSITSPVTVDYATSDQSAKAGVDYTATSGTLTFNPGEVSKVVKVPVTFQPAPQPLKTLFFTLSNPVGATIVGGSMIGTIIYVASGTLALYVGDTSVLEGNSGTTLMGFTVSMSKPVPTAVSVAYATADGTAIAGTDYAAQSGTLTFYPGQTQRWIVVPIPGNTTVQPNRTFVLNLLNASAGVIARPQAVGTIIDDDPPSAATTVPMYRLYNNGTKEHLYTTDANEYSVLGTRSWNQEGVAYTMFSNTGTYGLQYVTPLFRMYHPGILQHHWTTDAQEIMALSATGAWQYEGVAGYVVPSLAPGSTPLYRLRYDVPPLHLWTTDSYERDVVTTQYGWVFEGIVGYVLP
jgi:hypothetical protein